MNRLIENLSKQLQKVMTEHPDEVETDTYWRGVRIGLETAIEVARELDHDDKTCKCSYPQDQFNGTGRCVQCNKRISISLTQEINPPIKYDLTIGGSCTTSTPIGGCCSNAPNSYSVIGGGCCSNPPILPHSGIGDGDDNYPTDSVDKVLRMYGIKRSKQWGGQK